MYIYLNQNEEFKLLSPNYVTRDGEAVFEYKNSLAKVHSLGCYSFIKVNNAPAEVTMQNMLIKEFFLLAEEVSFNKEEKKLPIGNYKWQGLTAKLENLDNGNQRIIITCKKFGDLPKMKKFEAMIWGNLINPVISHEGKKFFIKRWIQRLSA